VQREYLDTSDYVMRTNESKTVVFGLVRLPMPTRDGDPRDGSGPG
jgi:hypothetical protein